MPIQNGVVMRPCAVYLNNTSWIHDLTDRGYRSLSVIGESWLDSTNYSVLRRLHQRKWVSFLMIKFEQFIHGKQTYNWAILQNTSMIQYKSTVILSWQSQEGSFDLDSWVLSSSRPFLYTLTDGCCCRDTVRIPPMLFCTSRRTCHKSSSLTPVGFFDERAPWPVIGWNSQQSRTEITMWRLSREVALIITLLGRTIM